MLFIFLCLFLLLTVFFDVKYRIIPNWLTFPAMLLGIAGHFFLPGCEPVKYSLLGWGFGLVALLPFFWVGGLGGGDVKFMAAVGALQGWPHVFFSLCYGGIIGGLIAGFLLLRHGQFLASFKRIGRTLFTFIHPGYKFVPIQEEETIRFPYGTALAAGALLRLLETIFLAKPYFTFS